ncbi:hypothetical protein [Streptomyces aureus]|uniref:hypothetical protein n=1 Tax=Streptomyces aureus TaxID=193461 RepID=UPI0036371AB5
MARSVLHVACVSDVFSVRVDHFDTDRTFILFSGNGEVDGQGCHPLGRDPGERWQIGQVLLEVAFGELCSRVDLQVGLRAVAKKGVVEVVEEAQVDRVALALGGSAGGAGLADAELGRVLRPVAELQLLGGVDGLNV